MCEIAPQDAFYEADTVRTMLNFLNRVDSHNQLKEALKQRYGVFIKSVADPGDSDNPTETYERGEFATMVDTGQIEIVHAGFGQKVVGALATQFTEPTQKFTLKCDSTDDTEPAEELIEKHRKAGNYASSMTEVDEMSVQVGSGGILVESIRGYLSYQKFSPGDVYVHHGDYIVEDGRQRPADKREMEDASAVIIRLGCVRENTYSYLAIYSRQEDFEQGRYVIFEGSKQITSVPDVGNKDVVYEHELGGKPANPLSWWANKYPDQEIPEFPVIAIQGGTTDSADVFPITESLYQSALEYDIDASHINHSAQKIAAGTQVIERDEQSLGYPLPRTVQGPIALFPGQGFEAKIHDSASSLAAMEILEKSMIADGTSWGVPDYHMVSKDHTMDEPSGVALAIKTKPLVQGREKRINKNRPQIRKLFEIEKAYLGIHAENDGGKNEEGLQLLLQCTQEWDPGDIKLPQNKKEVMETVVSGLDKGIYDTIEAIRITQQCTTDQEAMDIYDKMKDRSGEYPPLIKEPEVKKSLTLPSRS